MGAEFSVALRRIVWEDSLNSWRVTQGEGALGIGIFILLYAIGVGHLVWHEVSRKTDDTWREAFHVITDGTADVTLAAASLAVFAIMGTKTPSLWQ